MKTIEDVIADLLPIAKKPIPLDNENFDPYEYGGGNANDTFDSGVWCGEVMQARYILNKLGVEFEIDEDY